MLKQAKPLLIFALSAMTLVSCDEVDELTDIEIDNTFETSVDLDSSNFVTPSTEEGPVTISETTTLNLSDSEQIRQNLERIEAVTINGINLEIDNFVGDSETTLSDISIVVGDIVIEVPNSITLSEADAGNVQIAIGNAEALAALGNALRANPELEITFSGMLSSNAPVSFTPNISLDTSIVIDAI